MKTIKQVVLTGVLTIAAGSALAQGHWDRAEQLRQSSESNRPLSLGISSTTERAWTQTPVSQADRLAEEARRNSEMMRALTFGSMSAAGPRSAILPASEADRKVAGSMQATEQMKPN